MWSFQEPYPDRIIRVESAAAMNFQGLSESTGLSEKCSNHHRVPNHPLWAFYYRTVCLKGLEATWSRSLKRSSRWSFQFFKDSFDIFRSDNRLLSSLFWSQVEEMLYVAIRLLLKKFWPFLRRGMTFLPFLFSYSPRLFQEIALEHGSNQTSTLRRILYLQIMDSNMCTKTSWHKAFIFRWSILASSWALCSAYFKASTNSMNGEKSSRLMRSVCTNCAWGKTLDASCNPKCKERVFKLSLLPDGFSFLRNRQKRLWKSRRAVLFNSLQRVTLNAEQYLTARYAPLCVYSLDTHPVTGVSVTAAVYW